MTEGPEFSHTIKIRPLPAAPLTLEANAEERSALARRFGLETLGHLRAVLTLEERGGAVHVTGTVHAVFTQACAVSGETLHQTLDDPIALRFVAESQGAAPFAPGAEIELDSDALDELFFTGEFIDVGEAVAQSLALAIDPYAKGPNADDARQSAGILRDDSPPPAGPLAEALAALAKK